MPLSHARKLVAHLKRKRLPDSGFPWNYPWYKRKAFADASTKVAAVIAVSMIGSMWFYFFFLLLRMIGKYLLKQLFDYTIH